MKLEAIYSPHLELLLTEGAFDNLPPGVRRVLTGIVMAVLLASGNAKAVENPEKAKEAAELIVNMDDEEYQKWVNLVHAMGLNLKPQEFKNLIGVDYKWLKWRLRKDTPEKVAQALQTADTRLVPHKVDGTKIWIKPSEERKAKQAVDFFISKGMNPLGALALVGGFIQESRLDPKASNTAGGTVGIAQWKPERQEGLPDDLIGQLQHAWNELQTTEKKSFKMLQKAKTLDDAIKGAAQFERFNRKHEWGDRIAYTKLLTKLFKDSMVAAK